jgi:hypothetical protein
MRKFINIPTIGAARGFVKSRLYRGRGNRYNKASLSAEVAELADA